ncbi:hypothetical protein [Nostoc sp.]|uniref:hypothetical protein n=1 Tax=Nostoc sp. TaxID=1180 RepID=UPI002FF9591C
MSELFDLLTKYPVLIAVIVGTISAFVAGVSALTTTVITIRSQRDRERQQWVREKLQEIYSNCISSIEASCAFGLYNPEELLNATKWLNILLIYHSNKYNKEFLSLPEEINLFSIQQWSALLIKYNIMGIELHNNAPSSGEFYIAAKGLQSRIIKLASVDKRLHG